MDVVCIGAWEFLDSQPLFLFNVHQIFLRCFSFIVKFIKNKHKFFAEVLYKSMKGLGTHDRKLMHTCISRCEKDLGSIRMQFDRLHAPKTLASFIMVRIRAV